MKCKICGHRSNSLPAMTKHYRKKHPGAMKRKKAVVAPTQLERDTNPVAKRFCPHCGGFLG